MEKLKKIKSNQNDRKQYSEQVTNLAEKEQREKFFHLITSITFHTELHILCILKYTFVIWKTIAFPNNLTLDPPSTRGGQLLQTCNWIGQEAQLNSSCPIRRSQQTNIKAPIGSYYTLPVTKGEVA